MNKNIFLKLFSIMLLLLFSSSAYAEKLYNVLKVIDGDTIVIDINQNSTYDKEPINESCRLIGVSTTELGKFHTRIPEAGSLAATHFLSGLLAANNNQVYYHHDHTINKTDKNNRQLIYAFLPNRQSINNLILSSGYGIVYLKYKYNPSIKEKFIQASHQAYINNNGLWADKVIKTYWINELNKYNVNLIEYKGKEQ